MTRTALPGRRGNVTQRVTHTWVNGKEQHLLVTFGYDDVSTVLDHLDLEVAAGSSVAIVGATGSGKSTLARLLVRLYDVRSGAITVDGVDVCDMELADLRRTVSIVFEDTLLFHDTVAANIAFARPDAPMTDVLAAARLAGAADFVDDLPDGYDTMLGERGYSLSGGQQIGRAHV